MTYEPRKLNKNEVKYPIHNRELLAIVHCLESWRCYLEGLSDIMVLTDHK